MKRIAILGWSILTLSRAYILNTNMFAQTRILSSLTRRTAQTLRMSYSSNVPANTDIRAFLEKEIRQKKMTLASDPIAMNRMINDFYIPVYTYLSSQLQEHNDKVKEGMVRTPLFIGISAPQVRDEGDNESNIMAD